jgi:hypothetical protein
MSTVNFVDGGSLLIKYDVWRYERNSRNTNDETFRTFDQDAVNILPTL